MAHDKLPLAAARLARVAAHDDYESIYGGHWARPLAHFVNDDRRSLAEAWVSLHDRAAVTPAWLAGTGWDKNPDAFSAAGDEWRHPECTLTLACQDGGWSFFYCTADGLDGSERHVCYVTDRGQVRRVLSVTRTPEPGAPQ